MDALDSSDESYDDPISKEMLEDICDGSQSHMKVNRGKAHDKIRHFIKQINRNGKES